MQQPYEEVLNELMKGLRKHFDLVSVVVYGSVARGEARKDSDVDILVVADNLPDDRYLRFRIFEEAEREVEGILRKLRKEGYDVFISPIIKSREEASRITPLYLDMVEDAIILYDKDGFFSGVLERLRRRLMELKARRVRIGRMWYWRLKEDYRFGEVIDIE